MYFMSMWLHITCEVNPNIHLLIHFDVKMIGEIICGIIYGQDSPKIQGERRKKKKRNGRKKKIENWRTIKEWKISILYSLQ